jgi:hypothetical protein
MLSILNTAMLLVPQEIPQRSIERATGEGSRSWPAKAQSRSEQNVSLSSEIVVITAAFSAWQSLHLRCVAWALGIVDRPKSKALPKIDLPTEMGSCCTYHHGLVVCQDIQWRRICKTALTNGGGYARLLSLAIVDPSADVNVHER